MRSKIAATLATLRDELARLDRIASSMSPIERADHRAFSLASQRLAEAIELFAEAERDARPAAAVTSSSGLLDRIVLLDAPIGADTFRTKVKLKTPDAVPRPPDAPPAEASEPSPQDDLTRIRGIDRALAARLAALGVGDFATIAGWHHGEVRRISTELGLGRQISRQNWIEQAALLRGPIAPPTWRGPTAVTAMSDASPPAAHVETAAATVTDQGLEIVELPSPTDEAAPPSEAIATAVVAAALEADVASRVPEMMPVPEAPPPPAAPVIPAPPIAAAEPAPRPEDALHLIRGIDATIARELGEAGTTRWSDIADWRRADVDHWQTVLGAAAQIGRDNWIEQAALLAAGHRSAHALRVLAGAFDIVVARPQEETLPEPHFRSWQVAPAAPVPAADHRFEATAPAVTGTSGEASGAIAAQAIEPVTAPAKLAQAASEPRVLEIVLSGEPSIAATTETAPAPVPSTDTVSIAGRVRKLETELAALVANDTASPMPLPPAALAAPMPAAPLPAAHRIEDEEFQELHVGEAEVVIVPREPEVTVPAAASRAPDPKARNLLARLRRSMPLEDIDQRSYAAYHDRVEEATVEIVKPGAKSRP